MTSNVPSLLAYWFAVLSLLCSSASTQKSLAITYPPPKQADITTTFKAGQNVQFTWTSTWPMVTLQIWEGPGDKGLYQHLNLLTNVANTTNSVGWTAHTLSGMKSDHPMWLHLFNANDPSCQTCTANSSTITIKARTTVGGMHKAKKLGLGLGLGFGIPLLVLGAALIWLLLRRRRRQRSGAREQEEPLTDWKQQTSPISGQSYPTPVSGHFKIPVEQVEMDNNQVMELPSGGVVVEAPGQNERVELEGDVVDRR